MPDPSQLDDDWAELARELERDKPTSSSASHDPVEPETAAHHPSAEADESPVDELEDGGDDGPEGEGEGDPEAGDDAASGDGTPGTGRKRRRRRRRRRKGGAAPTGEAAEADDAEKPGTEEPETEEVEAAAYPEESEEPSQEEEESLVAESEEDAGGELLRELIDNWNVPSWDDVVGGLYRPER
jgi:ribonuclease E